MKRRGVSIHELKRRLMRKMTQDKNSYYKVDLVAREIREHAVALAFLSGRSVTGICCDMDLGAAWDDVRVLAAVRSRVKARS